MRREICGKKRDRGEAIDCGDLGAGYSVGVRGYREGLA